MAVCMISPQSITLATGTRIEFMPLRDRCAIDVAEPQVSGEVVVHRLSFTPAGQVMSIRRLTPGEAPAKE